MAGLQRLLDRAAAGAQRRKAGEERRCGTSQAARASRTGTGAGLPKDSGIAALAYLHPGKSGSGAASLVFLRGFKSTREGFTLASSFGALIESGGDGRAGHPLTGGQQ